MASKKDNLPLNVDNDTEQTSSITYANEVVSIIAGLAAGEVEGIAGMCNISGSILSHFIFQAFNFTVKSFILRQHMCNLVSKIFRRCFQKIGCIFQRFFHLSIILHQAVGSQSLNSPHAGSHAALRDNLESHDL